jgi:hypothetical protein
MLRRRNDVSLTQILYIQLKTASFYSYLQENILFFHETYIFHYKNQSINYFVRNNGRLLREPNEITKQERNSELLLFICPLPLVFKITYIRTVNSLLGIMHCFTTFAQLLTGIVCMVPPLSIRCHLPQRCCSSCHRTCNSPWRINANSKFSHWYSSTLIYMYYIRKNNYFYRRLKKSDCLYKNFISIVR